MAEDTPSGLSRRELFVDARDLQSDADKPLTAEKYAAVLTARGEEMLAENQLVQSFSTVVRTLAPTYEYSVDFFLGDTITAIDERQGGVTADAVERSVSAEGEDLLLTLGYGQPAIYDILKRKA